MNLNYALDLPISKLSIEDYIAAIGELPPTATLSIVTHNQADLLATTKGLYKGISLWLKVLILGQEMSEELSLYAHYRPIAEVIKAEYNLAIGTYTYSEFLQSNFDNPAFLWFFITTEESMIQVKKSGLDGYYSPLNTKHEYYTFLTWFRENIETDNIPREENPTKIKPIDGVISRFKLLLHMKAYLIKLSDKNFKKLYYDPYWKAYQHFTSYMRHCPELQFYRITEADEIIGTGGKGRGNRKL